jgi:hypothetical protein
MRATAMAAGLLLLAAFVGAAVRLLPWVLDPTIGWTMLAPFAKSLLSVAIEAAVVTGWGVGWALAAQRLVDRGEARVLASLGESPLRTILRLAPQAAFLSAILAFTSIALGREAAAPGRVVDALLAEGRTACATASSADTRSVPFVSATWLCSGNGDAHLVGRSPLGGIVFTAANAHVSEDLRRIDLDDARLVLNREDAPRVRVHVASLVLRGLAPWARASSLPPALRAIVVILSGLVAASAAVYALLRVRSRRIGGIAATAMGAAGPLGALGALRSLEVRIPESDPGPWLALFALVPLAAALAVAGVVVLVTLLPEARTTGTK